MGGNEMRKILCTLLLTICLLGCGGCKLIEGMVSNVGTWDLSACVDGFDTCWELFTDNTDKFEDGFVDGMNTLFP
ncbi:hypothetical protein LCGC14_0426690 [marine sediment metagenome]|uniref:Uncharacterized protein n=1 Tax=marine sediment metagenome TaxID=412755 RepID=A0A0F9VYT5_9ZZZZ